MPLNEKREIVSKNKDPAIAAIQSVLDSYYNLLAPITDNENKLKPNFLIEEKAKLFAEGMLEDTEKWELILKKIKENEELSNVDIAHIGLAFSFCAMRAKDQIKSMEKAFELCNSLSEQLSSKIEES